MKDKIYSNVPVFENGMAQPVFPFTDGKSGENYDPSTSDIVRYCVYVESDYDMDGDGENSRSSTEKCGGRKLQSSLFI